MSNEELIELNSKKKIQQSTWITGYLVVYDLLAVSFAYFAALWLRFDLRFSMIQQPYLEMWAKFAPWYAVFCIVVFMVFKLYKSIWRFASFKELQRITLATAVTTVCHVIFITLLLYRMPISYYIMGAFIQFALVVGIRFAYRFILLLRSNKTDSNLSHVMLIGAGSAGQMIL